MKEVMGRAFNVSFCFFLTGAIGMIIFGALGSEPRKKSDDERYTEAYENYIRDQLDD